ncbi:hypothetical protein [Helicobacter pylori]|uniref:hypothetical protein n=1 Tax=Helicobacter pylori TaxID=210 RepID=UPI001AA43CFD|nr:hypothetical protein [Helicobacter pylori]GHP33129.1 hypothetical protein JP0039_13730 [Helicobacter pylori]
MKLPLSCKKCSKTCSIEWATKDYFIKGKTKLDSLQAEKELLKLSFIYGSKEISYKWKAMGKTFTMHQHVYEPIFEALKIIL